MEFINKAIAQKKIKKAESEIKRMKRLIKYQQERLDTPSEYKLIHKICTKYDIPLDIELYINSFLQKSKMKQVYRYIENIGTLRNQPDWCPTNFYYEQTRICVPDPLPKGEGGLKRTDTKEPHAFSRWGEKYSFRIDKEVSNYIHTGYGIRFQTRSRRECNYFNYYGGCFNVKNEIDKNILIGHLEHYKIPYFKRDSRHTLLCRLLGKDPTDPVYTKEVKARVGRG